MAQPGGEVAAVPSRPPLGGGDHGHGASQRQLATIEPGKPWQNGSVESFNGTFRRECLAAEESAHPREGRIVIEPWRWEYNTQRPHSSLGYRTPAEVGAEARAAMKSESRAIEIADPVACSEADGEEVRVEVHPITRDSLS